ncbi:UNVERIFIED_ORG: hypothetical protein BCL66_103341 [Martelella mediterranea]
MGGTDLFDGRLKAGAFAMEDAVKGYCCLS